MDKVKIGFPIEYEDKNNIVRNGLFLREPEIKELEKRLKEINKITDLKQQWKKKKEVIDRILSETKETRNILNNNRDDNMLSKSCLLSYLEIVEDLLKEVSEWI